MRKEQQDQIIMMAMIGTFFTIYAAARGAANATNEIIDAAGSAAREVTNAGKTIIDTAEALANPGKTIGEFIGGKLR